MKRAGGRRPTVGREASSEAAHGAERQSHVIRSGRMSFTRYSLLHYASLTVRSLASLLPSSERASGGEGRGEGRSDQSERHAGTTGGFSVTR